MSEMTYSEALEIITELGDELLDTFADYEPLNNFSFDLVDFIRDGGHNEATAKTLDNLLAEIQERMKQIKDEADLARGKGRWRL